MPTTTSDAPDTEGVKPEPETPTEQGIREMVIEHPNRWTRAFFAGMYGVDLDGNPITEAERERLAEYRIVVCPS